MRCYGILRLQGERIAASLVERGVAEKHAQRWVEEWNLALDDGSDGLTSMEAAANRFSQLACIALALVDLAPEDEW